MWEENLELYAHALSLSRSEAKRFKCTAEHLRPRKDGGKDAAHNIVAACLHCNQNRHRRKANLSPRAYRELVSQRLGKGGWHYKRVTARILH